MPQNDVLISQYAKQQVVRDRNSNSLLTWSAYVANEQIPIEKPSEDWVRVRLVAERMPQQTASYVERTLSYFQMDPNCVTNIRQFLSEWNDEATETALSQQNEGIIGGFISKFASLDVSDEQVQAWYAAHGFGAADF